MYTAVYDPADRLARSGLFFYVRYYSCFYSSFVTSFTRESELPKEAIIIRTIRPYTSNISAKYKIEKNNTLYTIIRCRLLYYACICIPAAALECYTH